MAPSKIPWLRNPDLFLVSQGGVAKVWKCKRTLTSEATSLMKQDDFEYVDDVHNYLDLIESMFKWREDDYKELVKYITQRSLLVNGQGLVIAELLLKSGGPDHGKKIDGPLYMWSLHIIALDTYIDHYRVRPIPFRPIQFLDDDKNGPAGSSSNRDVPVELSPSERKLTAELEKEKNDSDKKGLKKENAKLKEKLEKDKKAADKQVTELKETNKTLKSGKEAAEKEATELKETNKTLKSGKEATEKEATELKETNKTLRSEKEASDKQVKDLQDRIESLTKKPDWMSDLNIPEDNNMGWASLSALASSNHELTLVGSHGSFTTEDDTTNVRASYFYKLTSTYFGDVNTWIGIDIESLPKKEKARFIKKVWFVAHPYVTKVVSRLNLASGQIIYY